MGGCKWARGVVRLLRAAAGIRLPCRQTGGEPLLFFVFQLQKSTIPEGLLGRGRNHASKLRPPTDTCHISAGETHALVVASRAVRIAHPDRARHLLSTGTRAAGWRRLPLAGFPIPPSRSTADASARNLQERGSIRMNLREALHYIVHVRRPRAMLPRCTSHFAHRHFAPHPCPPLCRWGSCPTIFGRSEIERRCRR